MSENSLLFSKHMVTLNTRTEVSPLNFQSTTCGKSQYFIGRNQSMGNHFKHFACVLSYETNYLGVLFNYLGVLFGSLPQGVMPLETVECLCNFNTSPQISI